MQRIAKAVDWVRDHFDEPMHIETLIVIVTHGNASDPLWSVASEGVTQAAEDMGVRVTYRTSEAFDMPHMAQLVDAAFDFKILIRPVVTARPKIRREPGYGKLIMWTWGGILTSVHSLKGMSPITNAVHRANSKRPEMRLASFISSLDTLEALQGYG